MSITMSMTMNVSMIMNMIMIMIMNMLTNTNTCRRQTIRVKWRCPRWALRVSGDFSQRELG
jgi:hypothetical protein